MASRIVLHIGLQKSGSTYLQRVLQHSRVALDKSGVRYPVLRDRPRRMVANHEWATYGLLDGEFPWVTHRRSAGQKRKWDRLVSEVKCRPDTVVLSAEALSTVRRSAAIRLIEALATDRIDVVITARDLGRSLPSFWQQHIRNGRRITFDAYLRRLAGDRDLPPEELEGSAESHLWRALGLGALIRRWGSVPGVSGVYLVPVPKSAPPEALWTRFVEAIGFPELVDAAAGVADRPVHAGLTVPELEVLSAVTAELERAGWTGRDSSRLREWLVRGFADRPDRGAKPAIPLMWCSRVAQWSEADLAEVPATGATVVGELEDLRYVPDQDARPGGPSPTNEEIARAGATAIVALAGAQRRTAALSRVLRRGGV